MSVTHTPGKWTASDFPFQGSNYRIVVRSEKQECVCIVGNDGATSDHAATAKRWKQETPANARLIAAAPVLFDAAMIAEYAIDQWGEQESSRDNTLEEEGLLSALKQLRAAITLAQAGA